MILQTCMIILPQVSVCFVFRPYRSYVWVLEVSRCFKLWQSFLPGFSPGSCFNIPGDQWSTTRHGVALCGIRCGHSWCCAANQVGCRSHRCGAHVDVDEVVCPAAQMKQEKTMKRPKFIPIRFQNFHRKCCRVAWLFKRMDIWGYLSCTCTKLHRSSFNAISIIQKLSILIHTKHFFRCMVSICVDPPWVLPCKTTHYHGVAAGLASQQHQRPKAHSKQEGLHSPIGLPHTNLLRLFVFTCK